LTEQATPEFSFNEITRLALASTFLYLLGYLLLPDIHSSLEAIALIGLERAMGVELGLVVHQILMDD